MKKVLLFSGIFLALIIGIYNIVYKSLFRQYNDVDFKDKTWLED